MFRVMVFAAELRNGSLGEFCRRHNDFVISCVDLVRLAGLFGDERRVEQMLGRPDVTPFLGSRCFEVTC